ncbi:MAG: hypothetical protein AAGA60_15775, partial [Cyanobacteria bacterium P01_E01_bin.42]
MTNSQNPRLLVAELMREKMQLKHVKSQAELSRQFGVALSTVQRWVGKDKDKTPIASSDPFGIEAKYFFAIADFVGWSVDDLRHYLKTGERPDRKNLPKADGNENELEEIAAQAKHLSDRLQYYLTKSTYQLPVSAMHRLRAFLKQEIDRAGTQSSFDQKLQAFLLESPTKDRKALENLIEGKWEGDRDDLTDLYFSIAYSLWN